jgi:hypothetical protein
MSNPLLTAYRDRWRAVEEIERKEHRSASIEERWRQVNAIVNLASALGLSLDRPEEAEQEAIVRRRWARLRGSA